jgi:acetate CoA/acetoacetate CoA-transferase beta subunit
MNRKKLFIEGSYFSIKVTQATVCANPFSTMDLATGPRKVIIAMEHATKEGGTKILKRFTLPLTAAGKVSSIATELAFFRFLDGLLTLVERALGVTQEEIRAETETDFVASPDCREMELPA